MQELAPGLQQKKQRMSFWVLNANYEVTTTAFTKVTEEMIKVSRQKGKLFGIMKCAVNTTATCRDRPITVISSGSGDLWEDTFVTSRDIKSREECWPRTHLSGMLLGWCSECCLFSNHEVTFLPPQTECGNMCRSQWGQTTLPGCLWLCYIS